jgi:phospholipid N-methyltransferase
VEVLNFITQAVRDRNIGSLVPTSQTSVKYICRRIDGLRPVVVVEYGPGTGVFTKHLLRHLHPDSLVLAIELNRMFARRLRAASQRRRLRRPRLVVENDTACNIRALLEKYDRPHADYVLSGIPFSFFRDSLKREIIRETYEALKPGGSFLAYQFRSGLSNYMREYFPEVRVSNSLINLPPLWIMDGRKLAGVRAVQSVGANSGGRA